MHTSFETIVQAGTNAANPHLGPTMNKIEPNELVLFDLGTMHNGYASDSKVELSLTANQLLKKKKFMKSTVKHNKQLLKQRNQVLLPANLMLLLEILLLKLVMENTLFTVLVMVLG